MKRILAVLLAVMLLMAVSLYTSRVILDALGVDDSTDPSGIDAEASIRNGAHIIFKDTNNSTVDFHERQQCSLRDE